MVTTSEWQFVAIPFLTGTASASGPSVPTPSASGGAGSSGASCSQGDLDGESGPDSATAKFRAAWELKDVEPKWSLFGAKLEPAAGSDERAIPAKRSICVLCCKERLLARSHFVPAFILRSIGLNVPTQRTPAPDSARPDSESSSLADAGYSTGPDSSSSNPAHVRYLLCSQCELLFGD